MIFMQAFCNTCSDFHTENTASEATDHLIKNKTTDNFTKITKTHLQSTASKLTMPTQTDKASIEILREIPKEKYKPPEKQQQIIKLILL